MTLRLHLILLVVVCMLPAVALLTLDQVQLRQAREAEVRRDILEQAQAGASEVSRVIEGGRQLLAALQQAEPIRNHNAPLCSAWLGRLQQDYPAYASIVAADPSGRSFCTSRPGQAVYETDQPWFYDALSSRGFVVGGYAVSSFTHAPVLPLAEPITDPDGSVQGVLVLSLDLNELGRALAAKLPPGVAMSLVDRDGRVLVRLANGASSGGNLLSPAQAALLRTSHPDTVDIGGPAGPVRMVAAVAAGDRGYGLGLLAEQEKQSALAGLDRTTWDGVMLVVAGMTIALLVATVIAWRFIQVPVRDLLRTAEQLRRGDYGRRARGTGSRSELGRLGQALNALAAALAQREHDRDIAETQLLEFAGALEHRVEERTQALAEANARVAAEAQERQRAQATLAQAQKLDALGQLTGGVAHDFNNLLAAILGSVELGLKHTDDPRLRRLLNTAARAGERAAKLVGHLLAFSRKQELALRPVDVNGVVHGMSDMLARTIGSLVRIQHDLTGDLWPAVADPVQLEVGLLNLALNARDAMAEGGTLTFRSRNVTAARPGAGQAALPQGDYVMVTVSDTGHGMPPDVQARAFEPFFTTKGVGKGTGLGLSMVYGFATQAGGTVTIDSGPDKGTAVSLYLPRAAPQPAETAAGPDAAAALPPLDILLVDDDADIRDTTREMLNDLGHAVTVAESCDAALALLRGDERFDLLLTDFAMPEMTGVQLAQQGAALRPGLPVLLMTGYAEGTARQSWTAQGYGTILKPFNTAEMAAALRALAGAAAVPPARQAPGAAPMPRSAPGSRGAD